MTSKASFETFFCSLKSTLLEVTIACPEVENFDPISKKLPQTMTIQKLRLLIQRLLSQVALL
jgi:hypothetical protein